jgi:DNA polymerase-1
MLVIADGNNLAWAAFHSLGRAMGAETPEQHVRATLLGLSQSVIGTVARGGAPFEASPQLSLTPDERFPPVTHLAVVFDHGRPLRRREIWPAYQTGREGQSAFIDNEPYVLEAIRQFSEAALGCMPITILRGENTEADDLAATLTLKTPGPVRIVSSDRDFLQLVDGRVSIFSFVKKMLIDDENFDAEVMPRPKDGDPIVFPRDRFVDYRALSGDSSDDLPGVPGIGTLTAAKLLSAHTVEEYLESPSLVSEALGRANRKVEEAFASGEAAAVIERNRSLMDLRAAARRYPDLAPYRRTGTWDEGGFRGWLAELRASRLEPDGAVAVIQGIAAAR